MGGKKVAQGLKLYDRVAQKSSAVVINQYSTSFGLATSFLSKKVRCHIKNVYALVRLADEIVDGCAAAADMSAAETRQLLDDLEQETIVALARGYSANLVVHAFVLTARVAKITEDLICPFFASMRTDIKQNFHTQQSLEAYIYGSAEVVGLMCLKVFLLEQSYSKQEEQVLFDGAQRLGAAFQKINFLRDVSADFAGLGRNYFPGLELESFNETDKKRFLDNIYVDLCVAEKSLPLLPSSSRRGVVLAYLLFVELTDCIAKTPVVVLKTTRVSVSKAKKIFIAAQVLGGFFPKAGFCEKK